MLEFRVLGGVEVRRDGAPVALGGPQRQLLLAVLLTRPGTVVPAESVADALWGDTPPRSATAVLHAQVSRLRSAMEPGRSARQADGVLRSLGSGYRLVLDGHRFDAGEFAAIIADARSALARAEAAEAKRLFTAAEALWTGPAFGVLGGHPAVSATARGLDEQRVTALVDGYEARLRLGEDGALVAELGALVAEHPFQERIWGQLMLALYRCGRQADALATYQRCRRMLVSELGIEPGPALQKLDEAILLQRPELDTPPGPRAAVRTRWPAAPRSSFVGRAAELAAITADLDTNRLVTITGAGGVGKTRLAAELASRSTGSFAHGVAYCDLVGIPSAGVVEDAMAVAVGAPDPKGRDNALVDHLVARRLLLVVDNADHVVAEVARLVDDLLAGCPALHLIVTSREPLGVHGERLVRLDPLNAADPDGAAVQLFLDRSPGTGHDHAVVQRLCQRVDGLPLAIELAASMSRSTPVDVLVAGLDERLSTLVGAPLPRGAALHGTLRDVLAWSIEQLDDAQAALLRRLAVFANGFAAAAAATVCEIVGPPEIALAALVDRSLVQLKADPTTTRYRLLETIRADGLVRLGEVGELDDYRARHLAWCRGLAPAAADPRHGEDPAALAHLAPEIDNVVAALAWGLGDGDRRTGVELAIVAAPWWAHAGRFAEALRWLRAAVAAAPDAATAATAMASLGAMLNGEGDVGAARAVLTDALAIVPPDLPDLRYEIALQLAATEIDCGDLGAGAARLAALPERAGPERARDGALRELAHGRRALTAGDQHEAAERFERCAQVARSLGMWRTLARANGGLAQAESGRGNHQRAEGAITEALAVCRRHGLLGPLPRLLGVSAVLALRGGDVELARSRFEQTLSAARRVGDRAAEASTLANLGSIAVNAGDAVLAVELLEQALDATRGIGDERTHLVIMTNLAEAVLAAHADVRRALQLCVTAIEGSERLGVAMVTVFAVESAACALVLRRADGDLERAARFVGAAAAARVELGRQFGAGGEDTAVLRATTQIEHALGVDAAQAAHASGGGAGLAAIAAELVATCADATRA